MQDTSRVSQPARTHIVIGNGITALAFVEQCALSRGDTLIVLGERARQLGRGAAYAKGEAGTPWRYAYLLNSPADDIDPVFAGWLQARWPDITQTMTGRAPRWLDAAGPLVAAGDIQGVNAPREFYGDFMEEQAEVAFAALAEAGVTVRIVEDMGISVSRADGRLVVETAASGPLHADSVDIAPGGPSTLRIDGDDGAFAVPAVFGHEHQIAEHIRAGREIVCIGGNAAMLDVLRLCQSLLPEDEIKFTAIAPDGEIPEPLIPRLPRRITKPELGTGHATAESLLDTIEAEISRARAEGDEQREIRAGFRAHFLAHPLHLHLSDPEEAKRVPAHLRFWLRGGTRDTILDMRRLVDGGTARMVQGFVTGIAHGDDGATVLVRGPNGDEHEVAAGFVVNCAGAGPGSVFDPVTEDLLEQGHITRCPVSKGLTVGPGCRTGLPGVRHLSPATTVIGEEVMAMPLYDAHMLRTYVERAGSPGADHESAHGKP